MSDTPVWWDANPWEHEPEYSDWVRRMTEQSLHAKSDIALLLAMYQRELATAQARVAELEKGRDAVRAALGTDEIGPDLVSVARAAHAAEQTLSAKERGHALIDLQTLEELKQDAARYRWLRDHARSVDWSWTVYAPDGTVVGWTSSHRMSALEMDAELSALQERAL